VQSKHTYAELTLVCADTTEAVVVSILNELVREDLVRRRKARKGEMPYVYNS
jgi:predicted transcriptional regulator